VIDLDREDLDAAVELCGSRTYLWLHPWTHLSASLVEEVDAWVSGSRETPRVASARLEVAFGEVTMSLGERVVLASPGAARLSSEGPNALPSVPATLLSGKWQLTGPTSVSEHLHAVNEETSCRARLARALDERPTWSSLGVRPLWTTCRAWLGASGPRQRALSYAVLEGYRHAAANAKLWELAHRSGDAAA
jgi:hypothetical protein